MRAFFINIFYGARFDIGENFASKKVKAVKYSAFLPYYYYYHTNYCTTCVYRHTKYFILGYPERTGPGANFRTNDRGDSDEHWGRARWTL